MDIKAKFTIGYEIISEDFPCEVLYLLRKGHCTIYKINETETGCFREKIMTLGPKSLFGEEMLSFERMTECTYSVVAESAEVEVLVVEHKDFKKDHKYRKIIPNLQEYTLQRLRFIQKRISEINQGRKSGQKFVSNIEKGNMNIFMQKEYKGQVTGADLKTQKKIKAMYLRKEL
jgi:hypothetical protein